MSTNKDTYAAALEAVVAALDGLCVDAKARAIAHDPADSGYDNNEHALDCGRYNGAAEAYYLVQSMLVNYRIEAGAA